MGLFNFFKRRRRGFEIISQEQFGKDLAIMGVGYEDIKLPKRGTAKSAGYDVFAPFDISLLPEEEIVIPTGIKAYMKKDNVVKAFPRSGQGFKFYLRIANTVPLIDADYHNNPNNEGHIFIKIRNEGKDKKLVIKKGEAFCQFTFEKYLLADGDRFTGALRLGGMGSTDK